MHNWGLELVLSIDLSATMTGKEITAGTPAEPPGRAHRDGGFDKIINWAIMNEKAHLYPPSFGASAECNTNKAKGALGSHGTARTGALGHSRVLWATAQLGMH